MELKPSQIEVNLILESSVLEILLNKFKTAYEKKTLNLVNDNHDTNCKFAMKKGNNTIPGYNK